MLIHHLSTLFDVLTTVTQINMLYFFSWLPFGLMNKVINFCDLVLTQPNLHGYRGSLFTKASLIAHISVGVPDQV